MKYEYTHLQEFFGLFIPDFTNNDPSISMLVHFNLTYTDTRKLKDILKDLKKFQRTNPTDEEILRIWRENNQIIGFKNVNVLRELFSQVEDQIQTRMK